MLVDNELYNIDAGKNIFGL